MKKVLQNINFNTAVNSEVLKDAGYKLLILGIVFVSAGIGIFAKTTGAWTLFSVPFILLGTKQTYIGVIMTKYHGDYTLHNAIKKDLNKIKGE
jgi:hypothetical membrane protein